MCVPPPSKSHPASPYPPPPPLLGVVIQISKSVCPLTPQPPSNLLSPALHSPSPPLAPVPRVSIATWRRVFAYYTLCVTEADSLCMPARPCMWIYMCRYTWPCAGVGGAFRRTRKPRSRVCVRARVTHVMMMVVVVALVVEGCKGIGRRCEQRQMRNCHLRQETGGRVEGGLGSRGRREMWGGGRGARVCRFFVLCRVAAIPHTPAFHLGSELIPPSSLSRVGGSPDCHLPLLSLALPLSPWNFYESVLSLYMEKRMSRRRVVIFTGALFSGNRELPWEKGERGRMVLIFREESEARRGWFLGIALLSFAIFFFFCNCAEKE